MIYYWTPTLLAEDLCKVLDVGDVIEEVPYEFFYQEISKLKSFYPSLDYLYEGKRIIIWKI